MTHGKAVMDLRRGALKDSQWGDRAANLGRIKAVEMRVDAQIGKLGNQPPACRETNAECGYELPNLKLANLATRLKSQRDEKGFVDWG